MHDINITEQFLIKIDSSNRTIRLKNEFVYIQFNSNSRKNNQKEITMFGIYINTCELIYIVYNINRFVYWTLIELKHTFTI